ncbi:MAG: prepilin-type N-terminal cleavage/methylation domain-containing protein [Planctomycetota bacterium]
MNRVRADRLRARKAGFTLTEVLIALGILAVGITSIASLFPPAILLQKETVRDILGQQYVRSSEALLRAKTIDAGMLFSFTDNYAADSGPSGGEEIGAFAVRNSIGSPLLSNPYFVPNAQLDVFALAEVDEYIPPQPAGGGPPFNTEYPDMRLSSNYLGRPNTTADANYAAQQSAMANYGIADRSFPSYIAQPADRELYTVPFIRRGVQATPFINDWTTYAMLLGNNFELEDEFAAAGVTPYPRTPLGAFALASGAPAGGLDAIVCANPFDDDRFVPKVFRIPAVNQSFDGTLPDNSIRVLINNDRTGTLRWGILIQPGDLLLGDNGKIYRVVGYPEPTNLNIIRVAEEGRQIADDIGSSFPGDTKPLRAVWFALRPRGDAPSPLRDIRILSSDTVRLRF